MRVILLIIVLFFPCFQAISKTVTVHPNPSQELSLKKSWALSQEPAKKAEFWIGYSIERLMGESEYIGTDIRLNSGKMSGTFRGDFGFVGTPFEELLTGRSVRAPSSRRTDEKHVGKVAEETLRSLEEKHGNEKKVTKEIALLFRMRSQGGQKVVSSIQVGNVVLPFELHNLPVIWLGKTDPAQSFTQLTDLYQKSQMNDVKKRVITAVALHPLPDRVVRFAGGVIRNKATENELRKAAVYALEDQQNTQAVQLLQETTRSDFDAEIRKAAVYALGEQEAEDVLTFLTNLAITESDTEVAKAACYALADRSGEGTFQALARILQEAKSLEVRKASLYAIADHGAEPAKDLLMSLAVSDQSEELAKAALYALADLLEPNGSKELREVHRDAKSFEVRKAAIYAIADQEGSETVDVLGQMLGAEQDPELRKAIVYSLAEVESDKAIDMLLQVVENDSDISIRKAAVYALGDMDSPRAKSALKHLVKQSE